MKSLTIRCASIVVLAGLLGAPISAEVSMQAKKDVSSGLLVMAPVGITDGVDPIPQMWEKIRPVSDKLVLNQDGADRGDGRPDIYLHPETGLPTVVWAYNRGAQHDIAISTWVGDRWSDTEFLTSSLEDELDPRVFVAANGKTYVAWWVSTPDPRVMLATRDAAAGLWQPSLRVSPLGEIGRRPTVAVYDGVMRVAYERDGTIDTFNTQEIVVYRGSSNNLVLEHVFGSQWSEPLEPLLHATETRLWLDWKHSAGAFAFTRLVASPYWSEAVTTEWNDPSWIGQETVRHEIAKQVAATQVLASQN